MTLIILRGASGSGKTTFADSFTTKKKILSMDHGRVKQGKYVYDPSENGELAAQVFDDAKYHMQHDTRHVIIDNTNTHLWAMSPYIALARKYQVPVHIVEWINNLHPRFLSALAARNKHNVPLLTIQHQEATINSQPVPGSWDVKVHYIRTPEEAETTRQLLDK